MMAKAHIAVGMAAAFSIMRPDTIQDAMPVIAGAALGCLVCDLDCENTRERSESSRYRAVMVLIAAAALIETHLIGADIRDHSYNVVMQALGNTGQYLWFGGLVTFVLICTFASVSSHRGFAHSLMALVLETASLWMVFPLTAKPFAIAFISHLLLDVLNKKPVRLLYPVSKGFSFGWFYADRFANRAFAAAGSIWLAAAVIISMKSGA